jgi:mevalonate kinase
MIRTSAPGNVFLFGEHSVVYERPAIVAAINLRTNVEIDKRADGKVIVKSENYGIIDETIENLISRRFETYEDYNDPLDPLRDLTGIFLTRFSITNGFVANIKSEIPRYSGGLSSSSAVLSAMLKALDKIYNTGIELGKFFDWLYPFQVKIHGGLASGSEIISSTIGGINLVRIDKSNKKPRLERKNLGKHRFYIIIADTKIEARTKESVQWVRMGWEKAKSDYEEIFDRIKNIVLQGEGAISEENTKLLGELMNKNHEVLARDLGVSHPKINRLIDRAREQGAYGAKLSGGGKGGVIVVLTSKKNQNRIATILAHLGAGTFITRMGVEGVKIESTFNPNT